MPPSATAESYGASVEPVSLVVPVFNEQRRLHLNGPRLIGYIEAQPAGSSLIIVDDGSIDDTAGVARALERESSRVSYISRPHLGKGAAVEIGLRSADTPLSGYTDVDLSTPLTEVAMLFRLAARTATLVIGSREMPETAISHHQARRRELLGRLFNVWVRATITPGIRDTQCGAKFARHDVWDSILRYTGEQGFAWDAEVVAQAIRQKIGVTEVGIAWSHDPSTRVRVLRDGIAMAFSVSRIAWRLVDMRQRPTAVWVRSET